LDAALAVPVPRAGQADVPSPSGPSSTGRRAASSASRSSDVEASEQADQGERAFDRVVPGDAEQVQSPVDAVLPGLGGDQ